MGYAHTARLEKSFFGGLFSHYAEARVEQFRRGIYAKTVREMERLSDTQLNDIGVSRDNIKECAYQSVYHHRPYQSGAA